MYNIVSLFDGMSCGMIALEQAGIPVANYYASEVDKYAIQVSTANYPSIHRMGDVTQWRSWDINWASIDILIAGSPCQGFSFAGKQLAFDDPRSALFFVFVDILNHIKSLNPNLKFMLENVKMKKDFLAVITEQVGVEPVFINSALVCAQNRQRYYWCNWNVDQPEDRGIVLADIIESDPDNVTYMSEKFINRQKGRKCLVDDFNKKAASLSAMEYVKNGRQGDYVRVAVGLKFIGGIEKGRRLDDGKNLSRNYRQGSRIYGIDGKSPTIPANPVGNQAGHAALIGVHIEGYPRGKRSGGNVSKDGKTPTLTSNSWEQNNKLAMYSPASIVGRRLNERGVRDDYNKDVPITQCLQVKHNKEKTGCLTTVDKDNVLSPMPPGRYPGVYDNPEILYRKLTPIECERLQGVRDNYTNHVSNTQRYKMLGNGWQVDTIEHIFRTMNIPKKEIQLDIFN